MEFRLTSLGRSILHAGARDIPLSPRECALIALVCNQPSHVISRRELAQSVWPRSTERRARHSLSQLLYEIKGRVGHDILQSTGDALRASHIRWDVQVLHEAFKRAEYALVLECYGGRFLFDAEGIPELLDWRDEIDHDIAWCVAESLREQAFVIDPRLLATLISQAEVILSYHPHLTAAQVALVYSAARLGQTKRAELLYSRFRSAESDTDLPPLEHFLDQDRIPHVRRGTAFIGRDEEVARLATYWRESQKGCGQVVLITGESGIGKTHLADQFLRRAAISGAKVWVATCCAATKRLPYSLIRDLVADNAASVNSKSRRQVEAAFSTLELYGATSPDEARHSLTEAMTLAAEATSAVAPLVVFIDDAQWADQYTALLVSYWAHRLRDQRVLVLLTVRTHDTETLPEWITADLARAHRIELGHLSIESAREIVRTFELANNTSFDPTTRDAIMWLSAGRPFLLLEGLAAAIQDTGTQTTTRKILTPSAEAVLRRRFHNLPDAAANIVEFLAVWGKALEPKHIALAANANESATADGIDVLRLRGVVHISSGRVHFVHEMMREAAYRHVLPSRRALLHSRAATLAVERGEPFGFVAQHYADAGLEIEAGSYGLRAAREARTARSYSDYEYFLRMAREYGVNETRSEAAGLLAWHLLRMGRISEMTDVIADVAVDDPQRSAMELGLELDRLSRIGTAADFVRRASDLLVSTVRDYGTSMAPMLGTVLDVALDANAPELGAEIIRAMTATDFESEDIELQVSAHHSVWALSAIGLSESIRRIESVVRRLTVKHDPSTKALCYYTLGTLRLLSAEVTLALEAFAVAMAEAEICGDVRRQHALQINKGVALMEAGDLAAAKDSLQKALASPHLHVRIRAYTNLATVHYEAGRYELADDAATTVLSMNKTYQAAELARASTAILALTSIRRSTSGSDPSDRPPLVQSHASARTPYEDTSYITIARAELMRLEGKPEHALQLLITEADRCRDFNKIANLRLRCAHADMLIAKDPAAALATAAKIRVEANLLGANRIAECASDVLVLTDSASARSG